MMHRKTCKLRDSLGLKANYEAVGLVTCFWSWAAANAVDGDITGYSSRDIADAVGYKKASSKLLGALIEAGFVDCGESVTTIHDWEEHAALLMESNEQQKKNTRERVKRYRERRKQKENAECNSYCNVTSNECNAPTLPNLTLPNQTNNISGDGGDSAREETASKDKLRKIGLLPGEFLGVTEDHIAGVIQITGKLFADFTSRGVTISDRRRVFEYVTRNDLRTNTQTISENAVGLLRYAFEAALNAGKAGSWNYIDGVMARLSSRDIETEEQAREWDDARPDKET